MFSPERVDDAALKKAVILFQRLLPRSLAARVFGLYTLSLLIFVGSGLGIFYSYQFASQMEDARISADMLAEVVQQTVADSAVIGDYGTIKKTLEKSLLHSHFASAAFVDLKGGTLRATSAQAPRTKAPRWLLERVQARLGDVRRPIGFGGRDYGMLHLAFATDVIAGDLWHLFRMALLLAGAGLIFSKIEAGHMELETIPFDLAGTIANVVGALEPQATAKRLAMALRMAPDLPPRVVGDPVRLGQIVTNLLGNAIKFTERGSITIAAERGEALPVGQIRLHFAVSDTGIPPDKLQCIFEAFVQADSSVTRRFGGTGLGLAISRRLVASMGGTLRVQREPERGSTFSFDILARLPIESSETTCPDTGEPGTLPGGRYGRQCSQTHQPRRTVRGPVPLPGPTRTP